MKTIFTSLHAVSNFMKLIKDFKLTILFVVFWLITHISWGARLNTTNSGLFLTGSTWTGGVAPSQGDSWYIQPGHIVEYDVTNEAWTGFDLSTNNGMLSMTQSCYFKMTNSLYGTGQWYIGTSPDHVGDSPLMSIPGRNDRVILEQLDRGTYLLSGTNTIRWYGDTNFFFQQMTNYILIGETNLFFSNNVVGVSSNDVIAISNPEVSSSSALVSNYLVYAVNTNCITLFNSIPAGYYYTNTWPGSVPVYGTIGNYSRTNAWVAKLTRPIVCVTKAASQQGFFNGGTLSKGIFNGVAIRNCSYLSYSSSQVGHTFNSCTKGPGVSYGISREGVNFIYKNCFSSHSAGLHYGTAVNHIFTNCVSFGTPIIGTGYGPVWLYNCTSFNMNMASLYGGMAYFDNCRVYSAPYGFVSGQQAAAHGYSAVVKNSYSENGQYGLFAYGADYIYLKNNTFSTQARYNNRTNLLELCNYGVILSTVSGTFTCYPDNSFLQNPNGCISYNRTNWYSALGTAALSNNVVWFYPSNTFSPSRTSAVPVNISVPCAFKGAVYKPSVSLWLTNGVSYIVGLSEYQPYYIYNDGFYTNDSMGWTNIILSVTNEYPGLSQNQNLFIQCFSQTSNDVGRAKFSLPTEYTSKLMP